MNALASLPQPGDCLFDISSKPSPRNREGSWIAYSQSYKQAADDLVRALSAVPSDTQAYPVVFLYRHFLELELKSVVALSFVLQAVEEEVDNPRQRVETILGTHDLFILCDLCRTVCDHAGLYRDNFITTFQAFAACVGELAAHDPGSFAFRYPIDKKLNPTLGQLAGINLGHLMTIVDKMGRFVSLIRHALERRIEWSGDADDWNDGDELRHLKDITGLDEEEAQWEGQ